MSGPVFPLQALPALKLACFWLGLLNLLVAVVMLRNPATGSIAILISAMALAFALWGSGTWQARRAWPHLLVVVLALLALSGLCSSQCGSFSSFSTVLGLPTHLMAIMVHAVIALIVVMQTRRHPSWNVLGDCAIACGVGASIFYATTLCAAGVWCSACMGMHAVMAIQGAELVIYRRGVARYAAIVTAFATAGLINAIYHHRDMPLERNDAGELLAYLRSLGPAILPTHLAVSTPRDVDAESAPPTMARAATQDGRQAPHVPIPPFPRLPDLDGQHVLTRAEATGTAQRTGTAPAAVAASRGVSAANRWGNPDAPVAMVLGLDMGCPICAQQFVQILELTDLIERGKLQIRILLTYRNDAAQAMDSLVYAAGLIDEPRMVSCMQDLFMHQRDIQLTSDAVDYLPASFPAAMAIDTVRAHQADITALMGDAITLKQHFGSTGDPTLWLFRKGQLRPLRQFRGLTFAPIVRLAVTALMPSP